MYRTRFSSALPLSQRKKSLRTIAIYRILHSEYVLFYYSPSGSSLLRCGRQDVCERGRWNISQAKREPGFHLFTRSSRESDKEGARERERERESIDLEPPFSPSPSYIHSLPLTAGRGSLSLSASARSFEIIGMGCQRARSFFPFSPPPSRSRSSPFPSPPTCKRAYVYWILPEREEQPSSRFSLSCVVLSLVECGIFDDFRPEREGERETCFAAEKINVSCIAF